jgi:predicted phosphodiesterase
MKIAILSDIKSNVYALEAVIQDAKSKNVDTMINLGDSLYGPIAPRESYELIKKHGIITVCGNEDRKILEASLDQLEKDALLKYVYEDLNEEILYWIQALPFEKFLNDNIYFTHGTQHDDSKYLLEEVIEGSLILRNEKKILELIDDVESKFVICGHSHKARCINLSNGQIVINPGSVGLQALTTSSPSFHSIENHTNEASYIILNIKDTEYDITLNKVSYDYDKAISAVNKRNEKQWAYALKTGKVQI